MGDDARLTDPQRLALTQIELDAGGCATPDCGHDHTILFLHGSCHPSAGCRAAYDKRTGVLTLRCRRCEKMITEIAVAADHSSAL